MNSKKLIEIKQLDTERKEALNVLKNCWDEN